MSASEPEFAAERLQNAHAATVEDVPDEKPGIDTKSTDMFPELGTAVPKPPHTPSGPWGKGKGVVNGSTKTAPVGSNSNRSPPGSESATPTSFKFPSVSIPGRQVEEVILGPGEVLDRRQLKRPLPDLIRDFNKKDRCTITHTPMGPNKNRFEATGPAQMTQDALRRFVDTIAAKVSRSPPRPPDSTP